MIFRDVVVAAISMGVAVGATLCVVAVAAPKAPIMGSAAFEWNDVPASAEDVRTVRHFFRARTATLDELELHVTTLPAGAMSHQPHQHPNEELVIVKEGTVEVLVNGQVKTVGPGSVIFNASSQMHSLRNVGSGPATYHVINWKSR